MRAHVSSSWVLVLSGCTLVVGTDPRIETDDDASAAVDASTDDALPDGASTLEAGNACDAGGCNATKDACKKTCADAQKTCNDGCNDEDGKSCHALCNQQMQACTNECLVICLQCITGCGTCGP